MTSLSFHEVDRWYAALVSEIRQLLRADVQLHGMTDTTNCRLRAARGFTLIEVVIALVILSFLSLLTMQAIRSAVHTKVKVQSQIDKTAALNDAVAIITRDLNLAFNYRDVSVQLYNQMQDLRKQPATSTAKPGGPGAAPLQPQPPVTPTATNPNQPDPYAHKQLIIDTQFIGKPDSLDFTSLSNVRMLEDSPISSQAEIGYHVKPCRTRSNQQGSSQCLWRRISNYIHPDDITKYGEETVLLENVSDFKLRYLGPDHQDRWVDTWISNDAQDDTTRGKFPYAVEITLEIKDPGAKGKTMKVTTVASIHNPNNPPENTTANGAQPIQGP